MSPRKTNDIFTFKEAQEQYDDIAKMLNMMRKWGITEIKWEADSPVIDFQFIESSMRTTPEFFGVEPN